jgi:hypothetical protein
LRSQRGRGFCRLPPWKSPPRKACRESRKTPSALDLFTEFGSSAEVRASKRVSAPIGRKPLFLNDIILFKYCTEMKIALPDGHLGDLPEAYPQSYPQNLWVSCFLFRSNSLKPYAKTFSSIGRQAFESA